MSKPASRPAVLRGLKRRLVDSSIDAYALALETINRLSIRYRVESFAFLICNAWELLLKARIIDLEGHNNAIYFPRQRGQPRRSLALRDCAKRIFRNEKDAVRRNLELVADLRDEATHLVISQVPKDVIGLFQACVLNYHQRLNEWWRIALSDRVPVGMMTLVYDLSPENFDPSSPRLRRQLGADVAEYLARFQAEVRKEAEALGQPAEFSIDISYKLALVKHPADADIVLSSGKDGEPARVVEVAKDSSRTHPYRQKEAIAEINAALGGKWKINQHDIQCICKVHGVKKRPDFYYKGGVPGSPNQYSQAFVHWVIEQFEKDPDFFTRCRDKVTELRYGQYRL
jgi:hypothetical protein